MRQRREKKEYFGELETGHRSVPDRGMKVSGQIEKGAIRCEREQAKTVGAGKSKPPFQVQGQGNSVEKARPERTPRSGRCATHEEKLFNAEGPAKGVSPAKGIPE